MGDDSLEQTRDPHPWKLPPGIWRFLWRGTLGGVLGMPIFVGYVVYKYPYAIVGGAQLPTLVFIAALSGTLVGGIVWLLSHLFQPSLGLVWRVMLGALLGLFPIAFYLYWTEGSEDNLKRIIGNSLVFGLAVGGLAGAIAKEKLLRRESN